MKALFSDFLNLPLCRQFAVRTVRQSASRATGRAGVALGLVLLLAVAVSVAAPSGGRQDFVSAALVSAAQGQEIRDWSALAAQVAPSVVQITTERDVEPSAQGYGGNRRWNQDFRRFFRDHGFVLPFDEEEDLPGFSDDNPFSQFTPPESESGSGFIVLSEQGAPRIITNRHVVSDTDRISVRFANGVRADATLLGSDAETDLALLRVEGFDAESAEIVPVVLGDSDKASLGSPVLAVGNPFGLGGTVTSGIVSARGRELGSSVFVDFIQTDAAINPGNSGGPLFNEQGEVIGVNTAIFTRTGAWAGIGFAIPSNAARGIIATLEVQGSISRGWLGVRFQPVSADLAKGLQLDEPKGALISEVLPDSPAEQAGLAAGDLILRFDGTDIPDHRALAPAVAKVSPGDEAEISVWRNGAIVTATVSLGERPVREGQANAERKQNRQEKDDSLIKAAGMRVRVLDNELRNRLRLDGDVEGLAVLWVRPGSPAAEAGLQPRDVILLVNGEVPNAVQVLDEAFDDDPTPLVLQIHRGTNSFFTALVPKP